MYTYNIGETYKDDSNQSPRNVQVLATRDSKFVIIMGIDSPHAAVLPYNI